MLRLPATLLPVVLCASAYGAAPDMPPIGAKSAFDGRFQLGGRSVLVAEVQGPAAKYLEMAPGDMHRRERRFGGGALRVRYSLDLGEWYAKARYGRTDDTIRNGYGFARQLGNDRTEVVVGRSWNGGDDDWWREKILRTTYEVSRRNDGAKLSDKYVAAFGIVGPSRSKLEFQYHSGQELQSGQLFDFDRLLVSGRLQPRGSMELGVESVFGDKMDVINSRPAEHQRVQPFLNWNLHRHLSLRLDGLYFDLQTPEGRPIVEAQLVDAQLTWQIHKRGSFGLTLQQQDVARNPAAYAVNVDDRRRKVGHKLRYALQLNPQTEFQLGFAGAYLDDEAIEAPGPVDRSWFVNLGYTIPL